MIETGEGDYKEEILELNKTGTNTCVNKRLAAGAIDFDRVEVKFEIDENRQTAQCLLQRIQRGQ